MPNPPKPEGQGTTAGVAQRGAARPSQSDQQSKDRSSDSQRNHPAEARTVCALPAYVDPWRGC